MVFSKSTPFHPFLLVLFPVLSLLTSNINEIQLIDAFSSFLIIFAIAFSLWFIINVFLKNKLKSGLLVSLGILLFFSYGYFLRIVLQLGTDVYNLPFSHHTYLVPIYLSLFLIGIIFIFKLNKRLIDATVVVNIISIVLLIALTPNIVDYSLDTANEDPVLNPLNKRIHDESSLSFKPNIYYIILDEYASDEILLDIYGFDNSNFLTELANRGFIIPEKSFTNYPTSALSISTNLNMDYVDHEKFKPTFNNKNEFFNNNQIMRILQSLDYKIINLSLEYGYPDVANIQLCPPSLFVNQFHNTLLDFSFWQPFSKLLVTAGEPQRERVNCKFSELADLDDSTPHPYFAFAHIMSPHPPYLFKSNGDANNPEFLSIGANSWSDKSGYVNQLQYVNKKTIETIDSVLMNSEHKPVIIIQGDHGTPTLLGGGALRWTNINDEAIYERMSILNAYYLPDVNSDVVYPGITPVNSFRLILNNYLNGNYDFLDDKMFFTTYQNHQNYSDVTHLFHP